MLLWDGPNTIARQGLELEELSDDDEAEADAFMERAYQRSHADEPDMSRYYHDTEVC